MLKVLIVDDEPLIREGLKSIIDWNSYGFDICGEAEDGREGLEKFSALQPDLAVIDIKMPEMNGLEMAKELNRLGIRCKIIILSAYSDFKFAQDAIELGVDSYLLKPIEESELITKIVRIREEVLRKRDEQLNLQQGLSSSRENILQKLVLGGFNTERHENRNTLRQLGFPWKSYRTALIEIETSHTGDISAYDKVFTAAYEFIMEGNYGFVFNLKNHTAILMKNVSSSRYQRLLQDLAGSIQKSTGIDVIISVGSAVETIEELPISYKNALFFLDRKFLYSHKRILSDVSEDADCMSHICNKAENSAYDTFSADLYNAVDVNNTERINNLLEDLKNRFFKEGSDEQTIKSAYSQIYVTLTNSLIQSNEKYLSNAPFQKEVLPKIFSCSSLQELHGYIKFILLDCAETLGKSRPQQPLKKLLDYIGRNYAKDLKLENLGETFGYNSAYLGKLFRQYTGISFNAYLDRIRMDKAREFLKEGLKVYQVARKVGYKDIDYFYRKFKKYAGCCPTVCKEDFPVKPDL